MSKIFFNILPFIFPLLALYIVVFGMENYFCYRGNTINFRCIIEHFYDMMLQKKAVVASILNIYFILLIFITGGIMLFLMVKSGV